jgi:hypothetical protein
MFHLKQAVESVPRRAAGVVLDWSCSANRLARKHILLIQLLSAMKTLIYSSLAALSVLSLTQCVVVDEGGSPGTATQLPGSAPAGFTQPLTAVTGPGTVTIREGSRTLTSFRTAAPNVEQTRWYEEQEQIVVKSRGNHGPATIQLFDSRSGRELGSVMGYEAANGPAWARSMAE